MPASENAKEVPSTSIKPRNTAAKSKSAEPALPELSKIDNDIIVIDPDFWFRKRFDDIQQAASELPVVIEYINESLQRASIHASRAKRDLQTLEAETYTRLRQGWGNTYAEKMTEKALDMVVLQDAPLSEAQENYSVLKSYVTRLANMQENLRSKLDMLRSVEATRRKLIDDDPSDS